ncbi:protein kinase [Fusarium langsethiae]|uniref:Protein kinase n=1 Tax=Fusarium langsethiae TaxID=179993 RepID=A0A0N0V597_FUSLA|nr:protein kinase [Fusarium langsethiae]GKU14668.1 unnamed protein product [Fusarium langsethiae]GKU16318.1 unnamed protein product [Fusarium langsethiae]
MTSKTSNGAVAPPQTPPTWSVIGFSFSDKNTNSELEVMCNGKCFVIHSSADYFSESPELKKRYQFFLEVAEEYEINGVTVEDFWDWIVEPLLPLFRRLPAPDNAGRSTLHDFFKPETFVYTLRAHSEKLIPELDRKRQKEPRFGIFLTDDICAPWPSFSPSEVLICQEKVFGPPSHTPRKVLLNDGTTAFLKLVHRGDKQFLKTELSTYKKIDEARFADKTRVPRLLGLVRDDDNVVFGLILSYIDCQRVTLSCAVQPETPIELREKWVAQIEDTVDQLHDAGIIWGDAKPDNVLIDVNQDAWVTDFDGGYTEGWVPKGLAQTVEGDCVALEKIVEYIRA